MRVIVFNGVVCGEGALWNRRPQFLDSVQMNEDCGPGEIAVLGLVEDDFDLDQKITGVIVADAVNLLQEKTVDAIDTLAAQYAACRAWL